MQNYGKSDRSGHPKAHFEQFPALRGFLHLALANYSFFRIACGARALYNIEYFFKNATFSYFFRSYMMKYPLLF